MPEVPVWKRECHVQLGLDHAETLFNELHCPFCGYRNPTPPTKIVQLDPESGIPKGTLKSETLPKREIIVIPDDDLMKMLSLLQ